MYQTVTFSDFIDAFTMMNRRDQFTYEGLRALFDYLEEYEESTGEQIELDVIALCCVFSEYNSAVHAVDEYDYEHDEKDEDESDEDYTSASKPRRWSGCKIAPP